MKSNWLRLQTEYKFSFIYFESHPHIQFSSSRWSPHGRGIEKGTKWILPADDGLSLPEIKNVFTATIQFNCFEIVGELGIDQRKGLGKIRSLKSNWVRSGIRKSLLSIPVNVHIKMIFFG